MKQVPPPVEIPQPPAPQPGLAADVVASGLPQHLSDRVPDSQLIIVESGHQLPRDGTLEGVKVELFTGNDQGRRGFIPQAERTACRPTVAATGGAS